MKRQFRRGASARTPLFARIRRAMRLAGLANRRGAPPVNELVDRAHERRAISRRSFLKASAAGAAVAGLASAGLTGACVPAPPSSGEPLPRIAILGGGMAGLHAAYLLGKARLPCTVYEASNRLGGRMFSAKDLMAPGLVTELGGEFIDSIHGDMLALVQEFGLELLDTQAESEANLATAYFFGGVHYSEAEVVEAFRPLAAQIQADYDSTGEVVDFEHEGNASELDNLSLADYLDRIGATGWMRALLEVAYVTEYGLDAHEQSSLNLIFLIGTDLEEGFAPFGESDERYKVQGGNQRVIQELQRRAGAIMRTGHRLEALNRHYNGYRLTFQTDRGARDEDVDFVICTIPFSVLRAIDIQVELPEVKRKAIDELGYGTNAKLMAGMDRRVWREQGYTGEVFSDEEFQLAWDNGQLQPGEATGVTFYSGGKAGQVVGLETPEYQVSRLLPGLERAFPGVAAAHNGKVERFHWPTHPFTLGSYACYKPGQWTTIAGAEFIPVGGLHFAGEHCSTEFQGYMNGAAETGRRAAEDLLRSLGRRLR